MYQEKVTLDDLRKSINHEKKITKETFWRIRKYFNEINFVDFLEMPDTRYFVFDQNGEFKGYDLIVPTNAYKFELITRGEKSILGVLERVDQVETIHLTHLNSIFFSEIEELEKEKNINRDIYAKNNQAYESL